MKNKIAVILTIALIFVAVAISYPEPATAQGNACVQLANFPASWTITQGTTVSDAVFAAEGTYTGITSNYLDIDLSGLTPVKIASLTFQFSYSGFGDEYSTDVGIEVKSGGSQVGLYQEGFNPLLGTGSWSQFVATFPNALAADEIHVVAVHNATGQHGGNPIGIKITGYCYDPSQSITATPQPSATPQPTSTPLPTETPLPSDTPSHTPIPTNTPNGSETAGPSPTLEPSLTPGPSRTPVLSPTAGGVGSGFGGGKFQTVPAPGACGDSADNPCGVLPFQPPVFSTLGLQGPTSISPYTPLPTMTGVVGGAGATVVAMATGLNSSVNGVIAASTFTISDAQGTPVSLPSAASDMGSKLGDFFGLIRSVAGLNLGKSGVIVAFVLLALAFVLILRIIGFAVKVIKAIIAFVSKIAEAGAIAG